MVKVFPSPSTTDLYTWVYVFLLILSLLVGPLAGWLADAKFGNYKVVRFGVWLLFLATVLNCFYLLNCRQHFGPEIIFVCDIHFVYCRMC